MVTGIRGRVFLSYRWSGEDFRSVVRTVASGLVRRGYEAIFDAWYIDDSIADPALHMLQELSSSSQFLAAISPDYLSVLRGLVHPHEFGASDSHAIRNDGWVRDELQHVVLAGSAYRCMGLCFGAKLEPDPAFPFPTFPTGSSSELAAALDAQFGRELDLPAAVTSEIKHQGQWFTLPTLPLARAYRTVRKVLSALSGDEASYFTHPNSLRLWSRLDGQHLIWEARAVTKAPRDGPDAKTVLCCLNCTAQFGGAGIAKVCPCCGYGVLERRMPSKGEALVVMRPAAVGDSIG